MMVILDNITPPNAWYKNVKSGTAFEIKDFRYSVKHKWVFYIKSTMTKVAMEHGILPSDVIIAHTDFPKPGDKVRFVIDDGVPMSGIINDIGLGLRPSIIVMQENTDYSYTIYDIPWGQWLYDKIK